MRDVTRRQAFGLAAAGALAAVAQAGCAATSTQDGGDGAEASHSVQSVEALDPGTTDGWDSAYYTPAYGSLEEAVAASHEVARTIEARFRRSDVACRFGGEEFTVLLPDTALDTAQRLANDLLENIRTLALSHGERELDRVTASLGVAIFPAHGSTPQALIEAADAALYRAKQSGRNRVVVGEGRAGGTG